MSLNLLKDIRRIYAGLNADAIREAAHQDLRVGLIAASEEDYRRMEQFLAPAWGADQERAEALRTIHRVDGTPHSRFDFVLCAPDVPLVGKCYPFDPAATAGITKAIVTDHEDVELSIARNYPLFRRAVADRILHRVSRENALFSLVTALPNVIPSFIDLPWALGEFATDTAFLTMNQIRMALLLAAAYDQTVGYTEQKLQIAAIAAGAFGWRALARELVGKIPLGGGLIPKAAVAFAGTYVVGMSLEKLNRTGSGLSHRERKDAYASAFARGKEVVEELAPAVTRRGER
jgi:hypothetical protein